MTISLLFFVGGLILLINGADMFTRNGAKIACGIGLSPMTMGLTTMAFGASIPELFVGIAAGISGNPGIALGNGIGSSIADILLVLGITAVFYPLHLPRKPIRRGILLILMGIGILWILVGDVFLGAPFFSMISRSDGLVLLCGFCVFGKSVMSFESSINGGARKMPGAPIREKAVAFKMVAGCFCLTFGARWVVDSAVVIAGLVGISEEIMGLTGITAGTVLPELATCITAVRRGYPELAVGTVVGAVFFNIFFVLGASAALCPIPVPPLVYGDMVMLTLAGLMMFVFLFVGNVRIMGRPEGTWTVFLYLAYVGYRLSPIFFPV